MGNLHIVSVHSLIPWLLAIHEKNLSNLLKLNIFNNVILYIVSNTKEADVFNEKVISNSKLLDNIVFLYFKSESKLIEWHGIGLDYAIENIKLNTCDSLIILDSDMYFNATTNSYKSGNILYTEKRPLSLSNSINFLPHPCFLYFPYQHIQKIKEISKLYSFTRRRETIIGTDYLGNNYGADTVDFILTKLIDSEKSVIFEKAKGDFIHLNGCTEVIRKLLNHKYEFNSATEILEYINTLDNKLYHDGVTGYYKKSLINNIILSSCYLNNVDDYLPFWKFKGDLYNLLNTDSYFITMNNILSNI
jgi:hypothetical protein